jgi:hypothetical protein
MKIGFSRAIVLAAVLSVSLAACAQNGSGLSTVPGERAAQFRGFVPNPGPTSPPGSGDCAGVANQTKLDLGTVQLSAAGVLSQPTVSYTVDALSCGSTLATYHFVYTFTPDVILGPACQPTTLNGPTFSLAPRATRGESINFPASMCPISNVWRITVTMYTDDPASQQFFVTSQPGNPTGVISQWPMSSASGAFYTMVVTTPLIPTPIIPVVPVTPA